MYIDTVQSKPCRLTFDPLKVMRLVNAEQLFGLNFHPVFSVEIAQHHDSLSALLRMFSDDAAEMLSND